MMRRKPVQDNLPMPGERRSLATRLLIAWAGALCLASSAAQAASLAGGSAAPPAPGAPNPSSAGSFASSYAGLPGRDPKAPWFDPNDLRCEQGCDFKKANETLSQLLFYTEGKYDETRNAVDAWKSDHSDSAAEDLARGAMNGFCVAGDDLEDCWGRYSRYTLLEISKFQRAILENNTRAAKLMSRRMDGKGRVEGEDVSVVDGLRTDKDPQVRPMAAYFSTYDEIKAQREAELKQGASMQKGVSEQFVQWLKDYPQAPSKDDFVLRKKIYRDPNNPSEKNAMWVIDTDDKGNPKYDDKAYQLALKAYQHSLQLMGVDLKADQKALAEAYTKAGSALPKRKSLDTQNGDLDPISRQAFAEGHGALVDAANRQLREKGTAMDFAGTTPRPAPPAKPKASKNSVLGLSRGLAGAPIQLPPAPKATPRSAPPSKPYTGNEIVGRPSLSKDKYESNTVGVDLEEQRDYVIRQMRLDVGQEPVDSVNGQPLPPIDSD